MLLAKGSLITLDFDLRGLDRAADTTSLFELLTERFQYVGSLRYPFDDGHRFAATALGFPANPNNAVAE